MSKEAVTLEWESPIGPPTWIARRSDTGAIVGQIYTIDTKPELYAEVANRYKWRASTPGFATYDRQEDAMLAVEKWFAEKMAEFYVRDLGWIVEKMEVEAPEPELQITPGRTLVWLSHLESHTRTTIGFVVMAERGALILRKCYDIDMKHKERVFAHISRYPLPVYSPEASREELMKLCQEHLLMCLDGVGEESDTSECEVLSAASALMKDGGQ